MKKEIWKDVEGYEGLYQASTKGRLAKIRKGKRYMMKPSKYGDVNLSKNGKKTHRRLGRIIYETFGPPKPKGYGYLAQYKDGNSLNTDLENLYWARNNEGGKYIDEILKLLNTDYKGMREYLKEKELTLESIRDRMRHGWTLEEAITFPKKKKVGGGVPFLYEYEGKWYTVQELADKAGMNKKAMESRISRWGNIDLAMGVPLGKKRKGVKENE